MNRSLRTRWAGALALVLLLVQAAVACSVPVFRYALERWQSDLFEVDVFYHGTLTPEQRAAVSRLEDQSQVNGGAVNWEVIHCHLDQDLAEDLQAVAETLGEVAAPRVVLRRPGGRRGSAIVWSGLLSDVQESLWTSPARTELVRRLASGDSVVWLVFHGHDAAKARQTVRQLNEHLPLLAAEIPLPAGVGLPGSELLTELPLEVRFSVLEIDDAAADETLFRSLVTRGVLEDAGEDQPIVVPVFGRGRAMTALSADAIDEALLAECSSFLCGACSCQVKQSNPGFDLLLAVNWDERLWGESAATPEPDERPPVTNVAAVPSEAVLVPIPPGRPSTAARPPQEPPAPPPASSARSLDVGFVGAAAAVMALGVGIAVARRRTSAVDRK